MFLKSISIENLRSIRAAELRLDRGDPSWTLVLGDNGSGKSTVLRAIAMVLAGRAALPGFLVDPDSWVRLGARAAKIEATVATEAGQTRTIALTIARGQDVSTIIENLEDLSVEEVMEQFDVTREQINAVLEFVAESLRAEPTPASAHPL